jgi:UDP-2,4-diacetamido-2,4,6-trideoxy-beta-L-altropyranose hydrolase
MRVGLRVDASLDMGTGHLRRCLSLAEALLAKGAEVCFVVRPHDPTARITLEGQAVPIALLPAPAPGHRPAPSPIDPAHYSWAGVDWSTDATQTTEALRDFRPDWVIVDHYALDARWHDQVRRDLGCRLMAVDDLADRSLAVEVVLDANLSDDHDHKYAGRLQRPTRILGGPRFAILGAAYRSTPPYVFNPEVRSLGVFMGGGDPGGVSARVLNICRTDAGFDGPIEIVSTSANPGLKALRDACERDGNTALSLDLPDLAAFYARHDLQIGGGGTASYERCRMGAPGIAIVLAPNQLAVVPALAAMGILRVAHLVDSADNDAGSDIPDLAEELRELIDDGAARRTMSERGRALVDGRGAERVALALLASSMQLRPATIEDGRRLHDWRNHPDVRAVSKNRDPIPLNAHMGWLARRLADDSGALFVAWIGDTAVGSIRFDRLSAGVLEVSLYLDPDLIGLGLGPHMLAAGEIAMLTRSAGDLVFTASVLPDNAMSSRLFVGAGYAGGPLRYNKRVAKQKSEP